jgi:prepilin-type N-terminal cleavage/methylation domain-containing protein
MSRISAHSSRACPGPVARAGRGFTLVELMVSLSVSAIVLGGVLAAYIFLGRNLARLVNSQHQQVQSRRTLVMFTKDLSTASVLSTATTSQILLTKPVSSGNATVTYTYTAPSPATAANGTLVRTETLPSASPTTLTILSGLTSFTFSYYNGGGTAVTSSPQSVKTVEFSFASAAGSATNSTRTTFNSVSPRVVLRNKAVLQ